MVRLIDATHVVNSRVGPFSGQRPFVATGDAIGTMIVHTDNVTFDLRPSRADLVAREGDVLFARMHATNKVLIVTDATSGHIWSTGFVALRPNPGLDARWLAYWLRSDEFRSAKDARCTGATQKAITNDALRELTIPLPPLSEQVRLVELVEDAESLKSRRLDIDRRTAELTPATFSRMFGDPTGNSRGYPTAELGEIAALERGRFSPRPRNDPSYFGGEHGFIQTGDISESDGYVSTWRQTLNDRGTAVSKQFPVGTIVFALVGATIGATAILEVPVYCTDSIVGMKVDAKRAVSAYVEFVLRCRRALLQASAPDAARANLNLRILQTLSIPLPPLAEQQEFASHRAAIRALAHTQAKCHQRLDNLFRSLSKAAFRGDL